MGEVAIGVQGEDVTVDVCEACGCVYLEYFDGEPGAISRALRAGAVGSSSTRVEGPLSCPDCQTSMELLKYLERGPELYRCGECMGVFADPPRLRALSRFRTAEAPKEDSFLDRVLKALLG